MAHMMAPVLPKVLRLVYTNETEGHTFGEECTPLEDMGGIHGLFGRLQKEFGFFKSRVYRDMPDGPPEPVGWYFESRMEYGDARPSWNQRDRYYIRGVWATIEDAAEAR